MNLRELLDICNEGYADSHLSNYYTAEGKPFNDNISDGLATFIVQEINDNYEDGMEDVDKVEIAIYSIQRAISDLEGVRAALESRYAKECG